MAKYISTAVSSSIPPITGDGAGDIINAKFTVAVDASLALNDLLLFGKLPASHEPVAGYLYSTDLDSSTGIVMTVGILNDAGTDLVASTDFITTSTVAQAGGLAAFDKVTGLNLAPISAMSASDIGSGGTVSLVNGNAYVRNGDRIIAGKITTAATGTKAAGTVGVSISYKAQ